MRVQKHRVVRAPSILHVAHNAAPQSAARGTDLVLAPGEEAEREAGDRAEVRVHNLPQNLVRGQDGLAGLLAADHKRPQVAALTNAAFDSAGLFGRRAVHNGEVLLGDCTPNVLQL
jgi:hypothetical protein